MANDTHRRRFRIRPATVAMVTAVAAIVLGVWDSVQNRRHNRLSVSPYLVCDYSMSASASETTFVVSLSNEGIGPAIIQTVSIELPAELGGGTYTEWGPVAGALEERGVNVPTFWNFSAGEALAVQRKQELFRAIVVRSDSAAQILRQLAAVRVRVSYASVYGDVREARLN